MRLPLAIQSLALATLVPVACNRDPTPTPTPESESRVPDPACPEADCLPGFRAQTIDATPISTPELKGRVTLVLFWASWCEPCTAEGPSLDAVYRRRKHELALLGITRDTADDAAIRTFRTSHGITYPIVRSDDRLQAAFGAPEEVPTFLLYGKDGRLRWKMTGALPSKILEREVDLALESQ
jgi:peroxiredoxin